MRFRKKPVVVEAFRFDGHCTSAHKIMGRLGSTKYRTESGGGLDRFWILTLEGEMEVKPDDWIIKGIAGEVYPCKPDIFAATYEPVEEGCAG